MMNLTKISKEKMLIALWKIMKLFNMELVAGELLMTIDVNFLMVTINE